MRAGEEVEEEEEGRISWRARPAFGSSVDSRDLRYLARGELGGAIREPSRRRAASLSSAGVH